LTAFFYVNSFTIFEQFQTRLLKKLFYIALVLLIFSACTKKSAEQNSKNTPKDSLANYLELANDLNITPKKREAFAKKAFALSMNQENDSMHRVNLFRVANRYFNMNNLIGFKETTNVVLEHALLSKDSSSIAKAHTYLGDFYLAKSISDSAYLNYFRAEKIYSQLQDNVNLAKSRLNKAQLQYGESDLTGSEISTFDALRALNGEIENSIIYDSYNLLGIVYNDLGQYTKALEYHNKALANIDEKTSSIELQYKAMSLNNIGFVYQSKNQHQQAIAYFEKGLENKKDVILYKPLVYTIMLDNLGYSRLKIGDEKGLPGLFYESLRIRDSLGLTSGVITTKIHLSEYFAAKNDSVKALAYSNEALATARNSKNARNLLLPLKQLAVLEPQKAMKYNKEYIHINDSLQKAERLIGEKFARIEYETDQVKEENVSLTTKNRNIVYIFGAFLILGMFLYIIKAQKSKTRELLYKQEQQRANEEIYNLIISQQDSVQATRVQEKKRVAQELHDGVLGRMFGVRMNLDSANELPDEPGITLRNQFILELKNIEQDIREISHDLSREKSELINNFVAIVGDLLENQKKTFQSQLISSIDPDINWESASNAVKINLFRVLQESLQNINKYANANEVSVKFKQDSNNLFLEISDDGVGFNINKGKKGIGLQNMISRMKECQGTFEIKSKIGEGTTIMASVPI
jgi:signal transduction histidine kinase